MVGYGLAHPWADRRHLLAHRVILRGDDQHDSIVFNADPAGGASAWMTASVDLAGSWTGTFLAVNGISCPTPRLCLAVAGAHCDIAYGRALAIPAG